MANEIKFIAFDEVSYGLRVIRYFVNRNVYKMLTDSCRMRVPARNHRDIILLQLLNV